MDDNLVEPSFLKRWWRRLLGFVLAILALLGGADFLYSQWERTIPVIHVEEADAASSPTLQFAVENTSRYFWATHMALRCGGGVSYLDDDGRVMVTANISLAPGATKATFKIDNLVGKELKNVPIKAVFIRNGARFENITSKEIDLEPEESKPFSCDELLHIVPAGHTVNSAKIAFQTDFTTWTPIGNRRRTKNSPPFSCKWEGKKFQCREGEVIPLAFE